MKAWKRTPSRSPRLKQPRRSSNPSPDTYNELTAQDTSVKQVDKLVQNQEFFSLTGTLLGAIASLVTIAIAIGQALKPSRLERRISRLNRMLEYEKNPNRLAALTQQRTELEASLFARERIPSKQYILWLFAMTIPFANQLSLIREDPPLWAKILGAIAAIFLCYRMSETLLNGLLQRRIVRNRYLMGQNPFMTIPEENNFEFTSRRLGKFYAAVTALYALSPLTIFMSSWLNGQNIAESVVKALGAVVAYTGVAFWLKQDIESYTTKISAEYIVEWDKFASQESPQISVKGEN